MGQRGASWWRLIRAHFALTNGVQRKFQAQALKDGQLLLPVSWNTQSSKEYLYTGTTKLLYLWGDPSTVERSTWGETEDFDGQPQLSSSSTGSTTLPAMSEPHVGNEPSRPRWATLTSAAEMRSQVSPKALNSWPRNCEQNQFSISNHNFWCFKHTNNSPVHYVYTEV